MTTEPAYTVPDSGTSDRAALLAVGWWLRLGFAGALLCVGALFALSEDGWSIGPSIAASMAGALLALHAWRKTRAALDRMETTPLADDATPRATTPNTGRAASEPSGPRGLHPVAPLRRVGIR